jgi:two-component system, OmpR family, sensor kinase
MMENNQKPEDKKVPLPESLDVGFFDEIDIPFLIHELKGPVAVIEAGIKMLLQRRDHFGPLSGRQEKTLKRSLRNSHKVKNILDELLEVGRGESGRFAAGNFRPSTAIIEALTDAVEVFSSELADRITPEQSYQQIRDILAGDNIFVDVSPEAAKVEIFQDRLKLQHIVGNLIKNALHHRETRIDIKVWISPSDHFTVEVSDDGPGVPPTFQHEIFKRYTQADACPGLARTGHGLGLAGAKALAQCLGGDIFLETDRGSGALFSFVMPISN